MLAPSTGEEVQYTQQPQQLTQPKLRSQQKRQQRNPEEQQLGSAGHSVDRPVLQVGAIGISAINSQGTYSNTEKGDGRNAPRPAGTTWPIQCPCGQSLEVDLFGFDRVNLTDNLVAYGRFGPVLQGFADGMELAVKVFEPRREGAVDAWHHECCMYEYVKDLQGKAVPRVCCTGMFAHTGWLFIAMVNAGNTLVGGTRWQEMQDVLQQLHSEKVLHGNIKLANFVSKGQPGDMKVIDLEQAELLNDEEASASMDEFRLEMEEVKALFAKPTLGVQA